jgi:prepilin-type N-terminal cleavage/methylation domain-containing protein
MAMYAPRRRTAAPRQAGFSLIELMIVVVIVGILAMIAVPRFTGVSRQAKQAEADPILKQLCQLAEADRQRTGSWPAGSPSGWEAPNARYFGFAFAAGSATATAGDGASGPQPDLANRTMNCATGVIQ